MHSGVWAVECRIWSGGVKHPLYAFINSKGFQSNQFLDMSIIVSSLPLSQHVIAFYAVLGTNRFAFTVYVPCNLFCALPLFIQDGFNLGFKMEIPNFSVYNKHHKFTE